MTENHKHKGVLNTRGAMRMHPKNRLHKHPNVQKAHNMAITQEKDGVKNNETKPKNGGNESIRKPVQGKTKKSAMPPVTVPVDDEGYLFIELDKYDKKGIRIKFQRQEGRHKKTVGLQIDK